MRTYKPRRKGLTKLRYKELQIFCQQYDEYQRRARLDPQDQLALHKQQMIDEAIKSACGQDGSLQVYLLRHVRYGLAFDRLGGVPCGREQFYLLRDKFFLILNELRK